MLMTMGILIKDCDYTIKSDGGGCSGSVPAVRGRFSEEVAFEKRSE